MVCIAAFIILCLLSVFVAILSIFRRDIGKKYWSAFKKAWGCVGKRVTFQKCETNFKEDVKNSVLKKVVVKKPKLVRPISVAIEVIAVLIVAVTVWSLVEVAKGGLAIYALGTCNVSQPDACVVSSTDTCPATNTKLNWFEEWGEIFRAIPDRMKDWDSSEYLTANPLYYYEYDESKPVALDIFDPGCDKCLQSFRNQFEDGFFERNNVVMLPYPTEAESRDYRFNNSYLITAYIVAVGETGRSDGSGVSLAWKIPQRMFLEFDDKGVIWQSVLKADETSEEMARDMLESWLLEWGLSEEEVAEVRARVAGDEVAGQIDEIRDIVKEQIHVVGVPTTVYDGKKHTGIYEP